MTARWNATVIRGAAAPTADTGRAGQWDVACPDCGVEFQETADGWRCPWATARRHRMEHDEPGFRVVACGRRR